MRHTATISAWVSDDYFMGRLMEAADKGNSIRVVDSLHFSKSDMTSSGWVKVGTAEISVELVTPKEMQSQQLATLQASLQKERADSQVRQNAILDRISKLSALTCEVVA